MKQDSVLMGEIENLMKINEEHKRINGELREENKELQDRISKAIEDLATLFGTDDEDINCIIRNLKGEENEI